MEYLLSAVVAFCLALYFYFTRHFNHWKNKNVPFVKPLPFVGNVANGVLLRRNMGEIFVDLYNETKDPFVGFFVLDKPCLLLRDPQVIKQILVKDFEYFRDRSVLSNKRDDPVSAHTLFVLKNPEWYELRTKISPLYTSSKIKAMSQLMEESSGKLINYLNIISEDDSPVDVLDACLKFTVDIITSTAFGIDTNAFADNSKFCMVAKKLFDWDNTLTAFRLRCYFLAHSLVKLLRMAMLHPPSVQFLRENFTEIMNSRSSLRIPRNDLIDILLKLKEDKAFTDNDILLAQVLTFFLAGYETSSSTMCFALYEMALNPDIQSKLREEIDHVRGKYGGINYEAIQEMEYLDMCLSESLRKYPIVPFLERKCCREYRMPDGGAVIDEDTPVFVSNLALHYDPNYFPDPERFDPERFSKDNKKKIDAFTYLAFGEGPRNCIGARFAKFTVKFGLTNVLKNFIVCTPNTESKMKFNPKGLVLTPLHRIKLKLVKIDGQ